MTETVDDPLRAHLAARLRELRQEYAAGEQQMAALDARAAELRATMHRISGAVQVLEEALTALPAAHGMLKAAE